jgi:thiamine monophosphate kinase
MSTITIRQEAITEAHRAEVAQAFDGPAERAKTDTSDGLADAADCLARANFFRVYADGEPVAFYVLRARIRGERRAVEITLAHGRAEFDLVAHVMPLIERQCAGYSVLRVETRRPGLLKKLERVGFRRASVILSKELP